MSGRGETQDTRPRDRRAVGRRSALLNGSRLVSWVLKRSGLPSPPRGGSVGLVFPMEDADIASGNAEAVYVLQCEWRFGSARSTVPVG